MVLSPFTSVASLIRISRLLWLVTTAPSVVGNLSLATRFSNSKGDFKRIIGGSEAAKNRYPYSVSLQDWGGHFCGGSLIARDCVLTAAHCVAGGAFQVRVGSDDVDEGELVGTWKEVVHQGYDPGTDQNDFSLVFLRGLASRNFPLVRINDRDNFPVAGEQAIAMGWGDTDVREDQTYLPDNLHEVQLDVITNEECEAAENEGQHYRGWIYDNMLCTFKKDKDACQGDSGGPLIVQGNSPDEDIQVGVVSWGVGCAHLPGVHSRISKAYDWITETVCDNSRDAPENFSCDTHAPIRKPTGTPTVVRSTPDPSKMLSTVPTGAPSTFLRSMSPSNVTTASSSTPPSVLQSSVQSIFPSTAAPTVFRRGSPSGSTSFTGTPSKSPSESPSIPPSESPSKSPSESPSKSSSEPPSKSPSELPSRHLIVTSIPSVLPSLPNLKSASPSHSAWTPPTKTPTSCGKAKQGTGKSKCAKGKKGKTKNFTLARSKGATRASIHRGNQNSEVPEIPKKVDTLKMANPFG